MIVVMFWVEVASKKVVEFGVDVYVKLANGYLLPCDCFDIIVLFGSGVTSRKWSEALQSTEPAGFKEIKWIKDEFNQMV